MKKILLSFFVFLASAGYILYLSTGGSAVNAATPIATNTQSTDVSSPPKTSTVTIPITPETTPVQQQTPEPAPVPIPAPKPKGQYKDGVYTGSPADAYYGYVQVQATIQSGKLTDVTFLQYPNDRRTSQHINDQAMPYLKSEALQIQSADVSGVSGATDTSMAFRQSLGEALASAKNS